MEIDINNAKKVLIGGIIGIIAVFLTIISDFILLGKPGSAMSFLKLGTETMADIASWRITLGTFVGVVALPFQIAGLIPMYYGLKPSGKILPLSIIIVNAHAIIMGVAFHTSYAFIGSGWQANYASGTQKKITAELMVKFDFYWKIIITIMVIEILFSSICYSYLIIKRQTSYPKWMAALNPLCVQLLILLFILLLPVPIGGFIGPAVLNGSTMVFFCISTVIIYKKLSVNEN